MTSDQRSTIGIEEEYLLVDLESRDLRVDPPDAFMQTCRWLLGEHVTPEFLRCQIEVGTRVCETIDEARRDLAFYRRTIAGEARRHGMGLVAASTHPIADWNMQVTTDKERYTQLARDLKTVARRLLICGMHVHVVGARRRAEDRPARPAPYFLPHLLALSTSSPFWRGHNTGLKSYRSSISIDLPRAGLPQTFSSAGEYDRMVDILVKLGRIEDASQDLVGSAAVGALSDAGDAHHRHLHAAGGRHRDRRDLPVDRAHADHAEAKEPALAPISACS